MSLTRSSKGGLHSPMIPWQKQILPEPCMTRESRGSRLLKSQINDCSMVFNAKQGTMYNPKLDVAALRTIHWQSLEDPNRSTSALSGWWKNTLYFVTPGLQVVTWACRHINRSSLLLQQTDSAAKCGAASLPRSGSISRVVIAYLSETSGLGTR